VSGGDGHLSAEVDSRAWGYNGGRTTFYTDDDCYVILYYTNNVEIPDIGKCSNTSKFGKSSVGDVGWNLKREGITFSSPIAQAGKPLPAKVINNGLVSTDCNDPVYLKGNTVIRLKTWKATLDPATPPPYGFMFIEYDPQATMWAFTKLVRNPNLINTEVHGLIWGVAKPMTTAGTWIPL
jgi:hypothetical protein